MFASRQLFGGLVFVAALLVVALAFVAGDASPARAQTTQDHDRDNDGLIEVKTAAQWAAIIHDLNGDGRDIPAGATGAPWRAAFPNAAVGAGCPLRDHDTDTRTPEISSCIGYELIADIHPTDGNFINGRYTAMIKGNGFRLLDNNFPCISCVNQAGVVRELASTGVIEGIGISNLRILDNDGSGRAGIAVRLEGTVVGSYVENSTLQGDNAGGFARRLTTADGTRQFGIIAQSYVRNSQIGDNVSSNHGGFASEFEHGRPKPAKTNRPTCVNSYVSATLPQARHAAGIFEAGIFGQENQEQDARLINCIGDRTSTTRPIFGNYNIANVNAYAKTKAEMQAATSYTSPAGNPFTAWNDHWMTAGTIRAGISAGTNAVIPSTFPRNDLWHFGDETNLPVLKGYGHDRTLPLDRANRDINVCADYPLAIANEIVRHLRDSVVRPGANSGPSDVGGPARCSSSADRITVRPHFLADLVYTTPTHRFNLRPDRTFPPSPKLTSLDWDDFAYLTNARYIDLSGNALTTLPPRLFQGIQLLYLDLSHNNLTSLPADLFAGVAAVHPSGNSLLLNNNRLTDTGLPGRIFDPLNNLHGLDLSHNNITRVNTRWFEKLKALGRSHDTEHGYTHARGIHLGGNTITEHYYSNNLFSGVRESIVSYIDQTSPAKTAGTALREAIEAAIRAANTNLNDLNLTQTSYYFDSGGSTTGYQAQSVTACTASQTKAIGRGRFLNDVRPACIIQPHWTPPHKSGDTATAQPTNAATGSTATDNVLVTFGFNTAASTVGYQLRWRPSGADYWEPWQNVPTRGASGTTLAQIDMPWRGSLYEIQLRGLSTTGPPSAALNFVSPRGSSLDWIGSVTATRDTAAGTIALGWSAVPSGILPTNHAVIAYYYRLKPNNSTGFGVPWTPVPDGADSDSVASNETAYTISGLSRGVNYDVQLVAGIDDSDADTDVDYFTNMVQGPNNVTVATVGYDAVHLTWAAQQASVNGSAKYQVRHKLSSGSWPTTGALGWTDVAGSSHSSTSATVTGLDLSSAYDFEVRFHYSNAVRSGAGRSTTATTLSLSAPVGFGGRGIVGGARLTWTAQAVTLNSRRAKYQLRHKKTTDSWPAASPNGWADISDSSISTTSHRLTGLDLSSAYNFELRIHWSDSAGAGPSSAIMVTTESFDPLVNVTAEPGVRMGQVIVRWQQQTQSMSADTAIWVRGRPLEPTGAWSNWGVTQDKPANLGGDADTFAHNETFNDSWITGYLPYRPIEVQVQMRVGSTLGPLTTVNTRAGYYPRNIQAMAGSTPGTIDVTWDQQTRNTRSDTRFRVRAKLSSASSWPAWAGTHDVPDSDDTGTVRHDETGYTLTGLTPAAAYDIQVGHFSRPGFNVGWGSDLYLPGVESVESAIVQPPVNFSAVTAAAAASGVELSWDAQTASTDADSRFQYRYKLASAGSSAWSSWAPVGDGSDSDSNAYNETSATVTGLTTGSNYDFELRFFWNSTHGSSTSVSDQAVASAVPTPPNYMASSGTNPGTVDLAWDLVTGATEYHYRYKLKTAGSYPSTGTGSWARIDSDGDSVYDDETALTLTGLSAGLEYTFQLRAHTASAMSPVGSDDATAQTESPPTSVSFAAGTNAGEINITWGAPAVGTPTGFEYRYKLSTVTNYPSSSTATASGRGWTDVPDGSDSGTDRADERAYTVVGLQGGVTYNVQIRTESAVGRSQTSAATTGTLAPTPVAAPAGFTATSGTNEGTIDLAWTAIPSTATPTNDNVVNYQYRYRITGGSGNVYGSWIDIPSSSTSSHTVTGLSAGQSYNLQLRGAIDDAHDSDTTVANYYSSAASVSSILARIAKPVNFRAAAGTNPGDLDLTWTAQTDFGSTYTSAVYQWRAKLPAEQWPAASPYGWATLSGTSRTSASGTVTGLRAGVLNDVQLRFVPASGLESAAASLFATPTVVPTPAGFMATTNASAPSSIVLSWTAQNAQTGSEAKYQYRRKLAVDSWPSSSPFGWTDIADGSDSDSDAHNESGLTLTGLTSGQSYNIELRFHWTDAIGPSAATARTATASSVPIPAGFRSAVDYNEVVLNWTQQTSQTGAQAKYQLRYKKTTDSWPAASPNGWADISGSSHSTQATTVSGLDGGSVYNFELRFHWDNTAGASVATAITATPLAIPAPANLRAVTHAIPGRIDLTWNLQNSVTDSDAHFQLRSKASTTSNWPSSWVDVADGTDSDSDAHNETGATLTGFAPYRQYDIEVRLTAGAALGPVTRLTSIRAGYQPRNLTAIAGTAPGTLVVSWDQQTATTHASAQFRTRVRASGTTAWGSWSNVGSAGDHNATGNTHTGLTANGQYDIQASFNTGTAWANSNYLPTLSRVRAGVVPAPTNFTAATATAAASAVVLAWDSQSASTLSTSQFSYRYKATSASWTGVTWTPVADSGDANAHTYDETGVTVLNLTSGTAYDFELRFYWNSTYNYSASVTARATASAVPTPGGFTVSSGTAPGSVDLSWNLVSGATAYQYRFKAASASSYPSSGAGSWREVPDGSDSGNSVADESSYTVASGLTAGSNYNFQIKAVVGTTSESSPATGTARAQTQPGPQTFTAAQGSDPGEIDLTWTAPATGTPTRFETRYKLATQSSSAYSSWQPVPDSNDQGTSQADETTQTLTSLLAGLSYNVQIRVISASGESLPVTRTQTATPVAAPSGFSATIGTNPGEIDLAWTALAASALPTNDTVVQYQFRTKLSFGSGVVYGPWTNIPAASTSSHTITGLNSYGLYDVQLRAAIDDGGDANSAADYHSNAATDTQTRAGIAVPANLQATGGTNPGEISLTWTAQSAFGATFNTAIYQVRSKLSTASWPSGGGWTNITGTDRNSAAHTLTGLQAATQYDIELRFLPSSSLMSAASSVQGTPTAVPTPTGFSATASTTAAGSIDLQWSPQTDTTGSEAKYQYRRKEASGTWPTTGDLGWTDIADGADADNDAYNERALALTSLTAGASYDIELRFHWSDAVGASSAATTTARASNVPTPLSFSASTGSDPGEIDLSWTAVASATYEYRYKLTSAGDSSYSSWASAGSGTSFTVRGLTNAARYTVQLRAMVNNVGSSPSTSAQSQAQSQPGPRNFAASQGSNAGEISLTWIAPSSGTVTRYERRYKLASAADSAYTSWSQIMDGPDGGTSQADETSFTIDSLLGGMSYTIQLRVLTAAGYSLPTTTSRAATPVAAPTNFSATIGPNPGAIALSWTAIAASAMPTGDTVVQYQYRRKLSTATSYGSWVNIPAISTSSHTITNLSASTEYDVQLRAAIDDGGDAGTTADYHSSIATQSNVRSGLSIPADLRARASTTVPGSIVLSWTQQSDFTASTARYHLRHKLQSDSWPSGGGWTTISGSTHSTIGHTLTDLTSGGRYDIELRFYVDGILGSSAAATVVGRASSVAVPVGFRATSATTTAGAIDLTWTGQSAVTVGTATYQVRSKVTSAQWPASSPFGWTNIPDSAADADSDAHNETSYTLTNLSAGQRYNIELRLFMSTAIGSSDAASATASASRVPVPTGFEATTGSGAGEVDLTWNALTGATGYEYRCTPAATGCTNSWNAAGAGTSATITGLTGGDFYNVQLRALVTGIGESSPTRAQRAQAQTTPGPATLTTRHGPNPGDIRIDWTAPANNAPVTHYEYRYKLASASDSAYPSAYTMVTDSNSNGDFSDETTVTIEDLQAGVSYHVQFRVYASSSIGYSLPQRKTQTARPVPPPTGFSATGGTDPGEVDLDWTPPAGVTILRYEARHRLGVTGAWSTWTDVGASPSHTYANLLAGMLRTFEVRAVMATVGESDPVATTGTPTPVPTPASFAASTGAFPGEVDLGWLPVTGATSYEYRYRLSSATWPDDAEWESISSALTSVTLELLDEGATYAVELRAIITGVGMSTAAAAQAASRSATFTDVLTTPIIDPAYAVSAAEVPGRISIALPGDGETFIYRYRTANPGEWSRWYKVTPQSGETQYLIPDLSPGVRYEIQVRAYTGPTTGFSTALVAEAQAAPLEAPEEFEAGESSGIILLQWASPALYTPDAYEYRTRPTGTTRWSEWVSVQHVGDRGSTQVHYVTGLETGISHDFQLRMQTQAGPSPIASSAGSSRLRLAEVDSIRPVVRTITVRAGDQVALTVDIYDTQKVLDNSIAGRADTKLRFRWSEQGAGGGSFANPTDERRVLYTVPSTPGQYTVHAEAQPDGICNSHHAGAAAITDAERTPCIAVFTIRVTGIPAELIPRPDPVNPAGAIPTSMTDSEGVSYAVFTPAEGGTFTGEGITITAPAAAVPDRTIVGISAAVSDIKPPEPVPGTKLSMAGALYDVQAIASSGDAPLPAYTFDETATACLPFPQEFRADLTNIVVAERKSSGELSLLSTRIRSVNGEITVCAAISQLPATIGVARIGLVTVAPTPTPATPTATPDTGAVAPTYALLLLTLLAGAVALLLTRMHRIGAG